MKQTNREAILAELRRRQTVPHLLTQLFPQQRAFVEDKTKRKALFVARRSGKSFSIAVSLLISVLQHPRVKALYIGLTKITAENVIWTHGIEHICRVYKIPHEYNKTTKTIKFKNGSSIILTGADASPTERDRLLGGKYIMVAIDECQSHSYDLEKLVFETLAPAVSDYVDIEGGGQILLAGTAGNKIDTYWHRITKDGTREPGWIVHTWSPLDNPHMRQNILDTWNDFEARIPGYQDQIWFRQQWKNEWIIETQSRVYKCQSVNNLLEKLPDDERKNPTAIRQAQLDREIDIIRSLRAIDNKWYYLLGVDLGYEDATAWCVGAFNRHDNNFYFVESMKKNHINLKEIAEITQLLHDKYHFKTMVIDTGGGGKLAAESLRQVYNLPFKAADKAGEKAAIIARMNSDFVSENIKVIESQNKELIKEWQELLVDEKKRVIGVFKEAEQYQNHLADAALYCYREAKHYRATPEPQQRHDFAAELIKQKQRTRPVIKDYWQEMEERIENRHIIDTFRSNKR